MNNSLGSPRCPDALSAHFTPPERYLQQIDVLERVPRVWATMSVIKTYFRGLFPFRTRIKFKLLMCFERLAAKKKVGFTVAGTAMTFPLFSLVIIQILLKFQILT